MTFSNDFAATEPDQADELSDVKRSLDNRIIAALQSRDRERSDILGQIKEEITSGHNVEQQTELVDYVTNTLISQYWKTGKRDVQEDQAQDVLVGLSRVCQDHTLRISGQILDHANQGKGGKRLESKMADNISRILRKQKINGEPFNLDELLEQRNYTNHKRFDIVLDLIRAGTAEADPELRDFITNALRTEADENEVLAEVIPIDNPER